MKEAGKSSWLGLTSNSINDIVVYVSYILNDIVMKTDQDVESDRWAKADLPPGNSDTLAPSSGAENPINVAACPQGNDCVGSSAPARILGCEQGCGFRGCAACMKVHEEEPHVSDSDQMMAMIRSIAGQW